MNVLDPKIDIVVMGFDLQAFMYQHLNFHFSYTIYGHQSFTYISFNHLHTQYL